MMAHFGCARYLKAMGDWSSRRCAMKWEDLPADIQRQIRAGNLPKLERKLPPGPPQPRQPRTDPLEVPRLRPEVHGVAAAQNHANEAGHVRIELILPTEDDQ
jgi:hypothetical protein